MVKPTHGTTHSTACWYDSRGVVRHMVRYVGTTLGAWHDTLYHAMSIHGISYVCPKKNVLSSIGGPFSVAVNPSPRSAGCNVRPQTNDMTKYLLLCFVVFSSFILSIININK